MASHKNSLETNTACNTQSVQPEKSRGGRPSKAALEQLNQRILAVAAELFATQGFAATSMEQVALTCGAGKDTIYRRYPSKTALFKALVEGLQVEVLGEIDAQVTAMAGTAIERIRQLARILLTINLRPQMIALNRVALAEAVSLGGINPTSITRDPIMSKLASLVEQAQNNQTLMAGDPLFIAEQLLYATSIKPVISSMLGDKQFSSFEEQERYFNQAFELFIEGAIRHVDAK